MPSSIGNFEDLEKLFIIEKPPNNVPLDSESVENLKTYQTQLNKECLMTTN